MTAPPELTRQAAVAEDQRINRLNQTRYRRTAELTALTRYLQREITRHQAVEETLKRSVNHRAKRVAESERLQNFLHLMHKLLAAHEEEGQWISRQLQDEIGQTLPGINVRLLALKQAAKGRTASLMPEIVGARRLVQESTQILHLFAHELDQQAGCVR